MFSDVGNSPHEPLRLTPQGEVDSDLLARWVVEHYSKQRYDVVFAGSANGAAIHLAAAVGAPWLPQTLLIPVRRRGVDRDDPEAEMRAGIEPAKALLESNPDLALHHMHDPNQDRLMIGGMSYFRVKWQQLPADCSELRWQLARDRCSSQDEQAARRDRSSHGETANGRVSPSSPSRVSRRTSGATPPLSRASPVRVPGVRVLRCG